MKALMIAVGMMAFVTVSQAQQWAYESPAPYVHHQFSEEDPLEGKIPLGHDEVPTAVLQALQASPFQHMTLVQAFRLQDHALEEVVMADEVGNESEYPLFLYELRLVHDGKSACLYFTPDGQLYERTQTV